MVIEGLKLMALGMSIVLIFLIILMLLIILFSRIFKSRAVSVPSSGRVSGAGSADDLLAVISAAISSYRNRKKVK